MVMIVALIIWWYILGLAEKKKIKQIGNFATYLITVPKEIERTREEEAEPMKDFRELMSVAEQFCSSFASLFKSGLRNELLGQIHLAFEIVAQKGQIAFYAAAPKEYKELLLKQLYSYYPDAHIEEVKNHNIFDIPQGVVSAGTLKLVKRLIYPIKTYRNLESDPLNALTNALAKLGDNGNAAIQILLEPTNERWRYQSVMAAKAVAEGKGLTPTTLSPTGKASKAVFETMGQAVGSFAQGPQAQEKNKAQAQEQSMLRLTPQQEELMKLFNEKGAKIGFRTVVRVVSVAPDETIAKTNRDNILAAFSQYSWPQGNSFKVKTKNEAIIAADYLTRFFPAKSAMLLNTEEIASIFHLPNRYIETPDILWLHAKKLPPPVNLPPEGIIIGKSIYRGEEKLVRMNVDDRRRHLFMIGKTGVGKTTFFVNMILQDIHDGAGVCFIDPLGDAYEDIIKRIPKERADDVILFDPSDTQWPIALNLLEFKNPEERDFLIQEVIAIFYKLFDPYQQGIVGPQWEHWARNAMLTLMSHPKGGTLIEIPRLFTDDAFREKAIGYVKDEVVRAFWEQQLAKTADFHKSEMYNYFISKFGRFMTNELMRNIIGQAKSTFDLREVMDKGKILLVNLAKGKIGEINSNLLGMILVSKIQMAAFSRADMPEDDRRDFFLYVDEFQNFTTETFATILSEARKYHLCLNITNQYIAQLTDKIRDAVIGNAGNLITYRIGAADAEFLVKEMPGLSASDMTNLDRFEMYVKLLINLTPTKPFSMTGIKNDILINDTLGEALRQLSRLKYGREKLAVEREIKTRTANMPNIMGDIGGKESFEGG